MKCFDKPEYCREIANYQLLNSLGVPTLKMIVHTDCSFVTEDIERSAYRLGVPEDMNDPNVAEKIALWYKTLHQNGRDYVNTHDFPDEYDSFTLDNLRLIQEKTGTNGLQVWQVIEKHFEQIRYAVIELPRTLVYTDFYYTNLAVARDGTSALMFDYNLLHKSYVYSDIRNVCWSLGDEAKTVFLSAYGAFDEREIVIDAVACELSSLIIACQRKVFPIWANDGVEKVKDGRLLAAVEKLLDMSKIIIIRKAIAADARDLANILCDSWQAAYKDILSPEDLERNTNKDARTTMFERVASSERGNSYIAFYNDVPCGHIFFSDSRDNDLPGYAEIVAIYSTEPYWGTGVGQRMMEFALTEIKRLGYNNVMLWAFRDNTRALRFYEKCGFVVDGVMKDSGFGDAKEVRYRLELK